MESMWMVLNKNREEFLTLTEDWPNQKYLLDVKSSAKGQEWKIQIKWSFFILVLVFYKADNLFLSVVVVSYTIKANILVL